MLPQAQRLGDSLYGALTGPVLDVTVRGGKLCFCTSKGVQFQVFIG